MLPLRGLLPCAAVALVLALLPACGGPAATKASPDDSASSSPTTSPSAEPWRTVAGPLSRCGPVPAAVERNGMELKTLRDRQVGAIPAAVAGTGPTAVVLLHQTNANGLCGWLPYASLLAEDPGLSVLAIDLCRYGKARCTAVEQGTFSDADQVDAVRVAVRHARTALRARRVVVMGASMGGAVALMSAAAVPGIDTVIDLSGPVDWPGTELIRGGKGIKVPALVAVATDEGPDEVSGARAIVEAAPEGSEFHEPEAGHGYELLLGMDDQPLPFAAIVRRWIGGEQ